MFQSGGTLRLGETVSLEFRRADNRDMTTKSSEEREDRNFSKVPRSETRSREKSDPEPLEY